MSTKHIENCLNVLHTYHSHKLNSFCVFGNMLTGDVAQMNFEDNLEDLYENGWEDKAEDYIHAFENELDKRKVK